jgi:hypothetical protein
MNRLTFDPTLLLSVDAVQAVLIVGFAVVGTYALGCIALLLIIRDRG